MYIKDEVVVIEPPEKELGLRLRMKAYTEGFKEYLDTKNIHLESYAKSGEVKETVVIKLDLAEKLIEAIRLFTRKSKKKRLISVTLVSK